MTYIFTRFSYILLYFFHHNRLISPNGYEQLSASDFLVQRSQTLTTKCMIGFWLHGGLKLRQLYEFMRKYLHKCNIFAIFAR